MLQTLTIALSKGRIFDETLPLLQHAGIQPTDDPETSRKLILQTNRPEIRLVIVRPTDVPTYVQYGGADLGVAGKDILLEHGGDGLYEPLDLKIARCRLMTAAPQDSLHRLHAPQVGKRLRVATKYVNSTRDYFARLGVQVEIIKLYGSMELAPLVGMADCIVDLVDTGSTLRANGLAPVDKIADISSRLIVNKAAMKMKHQAVKQLIDLLAQAVK